MRLLSLFSGAGGLDLGFEQAGFETVYATDIDGDSCDTLRLNRGRFFPKGMIVEQADICLLDPMKLPTKVDIIIGGPPCQSFSASGRRAGGAPGRLDERGRLFERYCRIIEQIRPRAFVFENVRGILGTNKGVDWSAIVSAFSNLGYKLSYRVLDALDYGAPQQRERMFLVGHQLDHDFLFPEPTHGPDSRSRRPHVTAGEALSGISEIEDVDALYLRDGKYAHLLPLVPPGQNYLFFTAKRGHQAPIFAYRSRFSDFLYKANPQTPIKTLIASPGKYTGPLHWENRYFTIREYMRLQGFPDNYEFCGNREDIIRQIGNSVSPKIAYQIALAIAVQIFGANAQVPLLPRDRTLTFDNRKGLKAKNTRKMHEELAKGPKSHRRGLFSLSSYRASVVPSELGPGIDNTIVRVKGRAVTIKVYTDKSKKPFTKMVLSIMQSPPSSWKKSQAEYVTLCVQAFGSSPLTAQAMWNAVDDWVMRSSDYHSLFELYGHFTEPHPIFSVTKFEAFSKHPIAIFAEHASQFTNCSRYFPKNHLVRLFGRILDTDDFAVIANYLRDFRFDIRSNETNLAIEADKYMVAYPFTLPRRKQMNFKLHSRVLPLFQDSLVVL